MLGYPLKLPIYNDLAVNDGNIRVYDSSDRYEKLFKVALGLLCLGSVRPLVVYNALKLGDLRLGKLDTDT